MGQAINIMLLMINNTLKQREHDGLRVIQSICAVLTFDPQLKIILAFSVKDRYQIHYFICIKDFNAEINTSLILNSKENDLP